MSPTDDRFADRIAIVTGAGSGLGRATALRLASEGAHVAGLDITSDAVGKTVAEIGEAGGTAHAYTVDVRDAHAVEAAVDEVAADLGRPEILVNSAGIGRFGHSHEFPLDEWDRIIAINLSSAFHTTAAALPIMRKRGWGRIVNIASAHGLTASPFKSAYVAAKHGVVGLTKVIALENAETDITCNAICPGWVKTPLVDKQIAARAQRDGVSIEAAQRALLAEKQPSLRFTTVEDIAEAVLFLCGPGGANITGTTLALDGGWTAR